MAVDITWLISRAVWCRVGYEPCTRYLDCLIIAEGHGKCQLSYAIASENWTCFPDIKRTLSVVERRTEMVAGAKLRHLKSCVWSGRLKLKKETKR